MIVSRRDKAYMFHLPKPTHHYRRFCSYIEVDTPNELVFCGEGWRNRGRSTYINVPLCKKHLRKRISEDRSLINSLNEGSK